MTVDVQTTYGADYVWDGAEFSWDSLTAEKAWENAAPATHDMSVNRFVALSGVPAALVSVDHFSNLHLLKEDRRLITQQSITALHLAETQQDLVNWINTTQETIKVYDGRYVAGGYWYVLYQPSNHVTQAPFESTFHVSDGRTTTVEKTTLRPLEVLGVLSRVAEFGREVSETLGVSETQSNHPVKVSESALSVLEQRVRKAEDVVFDVMVRDQAADVVGFRKMANAVVGYLPFVDLTPGDYRYQKALVRVGIEAPPNSGQGGVTLLELNVDVPDVKDRGRLAVPASTTTVSFNRVFTQPPEINCTLYAGTVSAIPEISNITTAGFDVTLRENGNPTNIVSGEISWAAEGY